MATSPFHRALFERQAAPRSPRSSTSPVPVGANGPASNAPSNPQQQTPAPSAGQRKIDKNVTFSAPLLPSNVRAPPRFSASAPVSIPAPIHPPSAISLPTDLDQASAVHRSWSMDDDSLATIQVAESPKSISSDLEIKLPQSLLGSPVHTAAIGSQRVIPFRRTASVSQLSSDESRKYADIFDPSSAHLASPTQRKQQDPLTSPQLQLQPPLLPPSRRMIYQGEDAQGAHHDRRRFSLSDREITGIVGEESAKLQFWYTWVLQNLPTPFLEEMNKQLLILIAQNLIHFEAHEEFSHIVFPSEALVLSLDHPDSDLIILERYSKRAIINFWAQTSKGNLPGHDKQLRVTHMEFVSYIKREDLIPKPAEHYNKLAEQVQHRMDDPSISVETVREVLSRTNDRFCLSVSPDRLAIAMMLYFRAQWTDQCQYMIIPNAEWKTNGKPSIHVMLAWRDVPRLHFLHKLARMVARHGLQVKRVNCTYVEESTETVVSTIIPLAPEKLTGSIPAPLIAETQARRNTFVMAFSLHGSNDKLAAWEACDLQDFVRELCTLKSFRFFDTISERLVDPGHVTGNQGNVIRAMTNFVHQVLLDNDPFLYSFDSVREAMTRHPEITCKIVQAFEFKFNPERVDVDKYSAAVREVRDQLEALDTGFAVNDTRRRNVLMQALNFVQHCLKTNFYVEAKSALAFRLDPRYLDHTPFDRRSKYPELPYGVFFVKGLHFFGFHVRFRDLARGGLRTVTPVGKERSDSEREGIFTEIYNLAYTQHKKNKDIPESGAKCIIFLAPNEDIKDEMEALSIEHETSTVSPREIEAAIKDLRAQMSLQYLYGTQRAFITSLMSIINCDDKGMLREPSVIDYHGKPEYIYLGPDENMHNTMIEWISNYAKNEHYKPGGNFISGRTSMGFNHKQYGVTSLGVFVYVEKLLKYTMGVDIRTKEFTVKISGGPDGDVAGNMICNLYRHCANTAKILVITDGSGTIYDPNGLHLPTLVEMFKSVKGIRNYPPEMLSDGGFLLDLATNREQSSFTLETLCWRMRGGVLSRDWLSGSATNNLFRLNAHQTPADVFIPCGGRPRTLNENNYKEFLDSHGRPSSYNIVEGANLYLGPIARRKLEELGVHVIKDSSANKCGVICSSYEVLCGLTLTEPQFFEEKENLIQDVCDILKERAASEADVLIAAHRAGRFMTQSSDDLSNKINDYTDAFLDYFTRHPLPKSTDDPLMKLFLAYVPKTLRGKFQLELFTRVPEAHKRAIISCSIACNLVYKRGIDWSPSVIDLLPVILRSLQISFSADLSDEKQQPAGENGIFKWDKQSSTPVNARSSSR